jgi:hypothetical protein
VSNSKVSGSESSTCTLARSTVRGTIQLSAAAAAPGTNASISTVVVHYLEMGSRSTIIVASGAKGSRTVIRSGNSTVAAASPSGPSLWTPKAAVVPFSALAKEVTIELAPFRKGSAVQLVSVEVTTATAPATPDKPECLLKKADVFNNATLMASAKPLGGLSSNDIYNSSFGDAAATSSVSIQRARFGSYKNSQSG